MVHRNAEVLEYFESVGIDPKLVLEGTVNSAGYDMIALRDDGSRAYQMAGPVRVFHAWESKDIFDGYIAARDRDHEREWQGKDVD